MKAIVRHRYGPPESLSYGEVETPVPSDDEVRIEVRAASLNPIDKYFLRGRPYPIRIMSGVRRPGSPRLGVDVAGVVESVGARVTDLKTGDSVFGTCEGAFAELACAQGSTLARKPERVSFEQAAAVPIAGCTALRALRHEAGLRFGHAVLINGAAGGVGTFAVQIARSLGAEVTGVCSAASAPMVRSIGAERVIDYAREDVTRSERRYDVILDTVANHSLSAFRRLLCPGGTYVLVGGLSDPWMLRFLSRAIGSAFRSRIGDRHMVVYLGRVSREDLVAMSDLLTSGEVVPVIDTRYRLSEIREAMRRLEGGHVHGKLVIVPDPASTSRSATPITVENERERRLREAGLDKTIENTFPASDPPSTIPNPPDETIRERDGDDPRPWERRENPLPPPRD